MHIPTLNKLNKCIKFKLIIFLRLYLQLQSKFLVTFDLLWRISWLFIRQKASLSSLCLSCVNISFSCDQGHQCEFNGAVIESRRPGNSTEFKSTRPSFLSIYLKNHICPRQQHPKRSTNPKLINHPAGNLYSSEEQTWNYITIPP